MSLSRGRTSSAPSARTAASLAGRGDCQHLCSSTLRELDGCRAHASGGSGHEHALPARDVGPVKHVLCGRVRARDGGELRVIPIAIDAKDLGRRHLDVLGESPVELGAERPTRRRRRHGRAHDRADQHPLPDSPGVHTFSDGDDATTAIRSLDPGEEDRGACPRRVGRGCVREADRCSFVGGRSEHASSTSRCACSRPCCSPRRRRLGSGPRPLPASGPARPRGSRASRSRRAR